MRETSVISMYPVNIHMNALANIDCMFLSSSSGFLLLLLSESLLDWPCFGEVENARKGRLNIAGVDLCNSLRAAVCSCFKWIRSCEGRSQMLMNTI